MACYCWFIEPSYWFKLSLPNILGILITTQYAKDNFCHMKLPVSALSDFQPTLNDFAPEVTLIIHSLIFVLSLLSRTVNIKDKYIERNPSDALRKLFPRDGQCFLNESNQVKVQ